MAGGTFHFVAGTLRDIRATLIEEPWRGVDFCQRFAAAADAWLHATAACLIPEPRGVALVAVGGYGRGELAPHSDLDLLVVHTRGVHVDDFVRQLSYSIYDQGIKLDVATRTPAATLQLCETDMRVALGLLDGRVVWGDSSLAETLVRDVRAAWATSLGARWLPELHQQMEQRHEQFGEVADLLEPDLKESHGGLRDLHVLRGVVLAAPHVQTDLETDALERANNILLDARVALHGLSHRDANRLLLQEQDGVAQLLHLEDADDLMRQVAWAGRTIARISGRVWRRCELTATEPRAISLPSGYELRSGELALVNEPDTLDALLTLAALAAEHELPLHEESLRAWRGLTELDTPWPSARLATFLRLLAAPGVVATIEDLEDHQLFRRFIPEWSVVHAYHQRNAYHRFTVDRHLLQTVKLAHPSLASSARPDLLLLACLFHDIGKGHPGDHTEVGIDLIRQIGPRLGLDDGDVATLTTLVRHHLLLADTASRRDLDDPATARFVASALGDETTLRLLADLTVADSNATGPSAWSSMKSRLVDTLVERTHLAMVGLEATVATASLLDLLATARAEGIHVRRDEQWITVATSDRPGLLAVITAVLAIAGVDIRSADLHAEEDLVVDRFYCEPGPRGWPDPADLAANIVTALDAPSTLFAELDRRVAAYPHRRQSGRELAVTVSEIPGASDHATVIELIAPDRRGLFSTVAKVLATTAIDVRAARLSTVGDLAIDTLYLCEDATPLTAARASELLGALQRAVAEFSGLDQ
jgi:[protein-PII] uridylyltransferase